MPKKDSEHQPYLNIFDQMGEDWKTIVDARETPRETNLVEHVLPKKGLTLDLCCGTGRHSIILRRKGWNMIGLDLSRNLLAIAKRNMTNECVEVPLVRAEMRFFPFRDQVLDAVICMYTSFGYLPSEADEVKSFREVRRTLRKNGRFLLDVANKKHVINVFRENDCAEYGPFYMREKRSLDLQQSRLMSQWTIIKKDTGESRTLLHNVRLYSLQRLKQMLSEAELSVIEVYGGYDGKKFSSDSSRMIINAQKTSKIS